MKPLKKVNSKKAWRYPKHIDIKYLFTTVKWQQIPKLTGLEQKLIIKDEF